MPVAVAGFSRLEQTAFLTEYARALRHHPDAVVIDRGAGPGTPMPRAHPPAGVDRHSVDLARVIGLRAAVVPAAARAHSVAASVAGDWTASVPADRPAMVADGLFAFVPQSMMVRLFRHIAGYFGRGELAFNHYGRGGPLSRAVMRPARQPMFRIARGARILRYRFGASR